MAKAEFKVKMRVLNGEFERVNQPFIDEFNECEKATDARSIPYITI